jgi:hypothetical protein
MADDLRIKAWPFNEAPEELRHVSAGGGDETMLVLVWPRNYDLVSATLHSLTARGLASMPVSYEGHWWDAHVLHGQPVGEPPPPPIRV